MALPAGVTTFDLTFDVVDLLGGAALVGRTGRLLVVDPSTNARRILRHIPSGRLLVPEPIDFTIGATGTATITGIPHTGQADMSPAGYALRVEWDIPAPGSTSPGDLTFVVPAPVAVQKFGDLQPATTLPVVAITQPSVISVAGLTGSPTAADLTGALGVDFPSTPNTLVKRGAGGGFGVVHVDIDNAPTQPWHAPRKDYVDALGTGDGTPDTVVRRTVGGDINLSRAFASGGNPGRIDELTRKDYVDALGTNAATANTVMRRSAGNSVGIGQLSLTAAAPADVNHATRKDYVDRKVRSSRQLLATDYTLALADEGQTLDFDSTAATRTVTVPADATVAFPLGTILWVGKQDASANLVTIAAAAGVTLVYAGVSSLRTARTLFRLHKLTADAWQLDGDDSTNGALPGALVRRSSSAGASFGAVALTLTAPTDVTHATRKDYVDPVTAITAVPDRIGKIAVVGGIGYLAVGTASTADWKQIT